MADSDLRVFIAIELPGELITALRNFQAGLKLPGHSFVKWVEPGSIHLTLKFLGNVDVKQVDRVKDGIIKAVKSCEPFNLTTGGSGCFPSLKKPRVLWLGLEGDVENLLSLQKKIDDTMALQGFAREPRPFTAHLTLARLREDGSLCSMLEFSQLVSTAKFKPHITMKVDAVSLIRSQLTPRGAIYSRLAEYRLNPG
jgi:2'-5' RNA ligase